MRIKQIAALTLFLAIPTACSDPLGPVDSQTISLTINSINSSDIDPAGLIEKDENISHETGNPWGEFIVSAQSVCGGDPVGFRVLGASVALDLEGSSGVVDFDDVVAGQASIHFLSTQGSDSSATRVVVASSSSVSGPGPVDLPVTATQGQLDSIFERLVGGDFHVGFRAETDRLESESFSMDVTVAFQARAICR